MDIGAFSISLNVKDLQASKAFYEKLGFAQFHGDESQGWVILKSGNHVIGLFQGMIEKNTITLNPGWDQNGEEYNPYTDVREWQNHLREQGLELEGEVEEGSCGPGSFVVKDPDGNPILFDQHR